MTAMPDTPIHEHRAVRWLMTQPEWPRDEFYSLAIDETMGVFIWRGHPGQNPPAPSLHVPRMIAHSLLAIAAARALWDEDVAVCACEFASAKRGVHWVAVTMTSGSNAGYVSHQYAAPTELLALLAAVEAVCLPEDFDAK